ncbi:MAG: glycosyltransferase family 4 protein, partial [bacterium]
MSDLNCFAYLYGNIGYAVQSRNLLTELSRLIDITVYPLSTNKKGFELNEELARLVQKPVAVDPDKPALGIVQPAQLQNFPGNPRIGYTIFEGTSFPPPEQEGLASPDFIWVASRWAKEVLIQNRLPAKKIGIVPGGVDPEVFNSNVKPLAKYHDPDKFTFLSVGKWEKRKGHRELIEVFTETFRDRRDVRLLLGADNLFRPDFDLKNKLAELNLPRYPQIIAVDQQSTTSEMAALYRCADIFVLLTRAEGWGLPIVEALACGIPAISTNYGPMRDYLSETYAFPVDPLGFEKIDDPRSYPRGEEHGSWAILDLDQVSKIFQVIVKNPQLVKKMGRLAEKTMHTRWSWK